VNVDALAEEGGRRQTVGSSDLLVRTGSAVVLLGIALLAAYLGGLAAGVVAAAFALVVLLEWATITGSPMTQVAPYGAAVAVAVAVTGLGMVTAAATIAIVAAIVAAFYARGVWLPAGVVYASVLGICLVAIRVAPELGFAALIFVLAVVWATDSGAFFAGRAIGGPKLAPRISPKKTWAGAVGGLAAAIPAGYVAARFTGVPITLGLVVVALGLSLLCQVGDLFESWLKRLFGAKDSGAIIPGHGGVMDRVDGLTFAAAAAVVIGAVHGGPGGLARGLLIW
jgi:phosphatidate cytidylyltransferase